MERLKGADFQAHAQTWGRLQGDDGLGDGGSILIGALVVFLIAPK
ncbi:MAG: hypothetical protein WDN24_06745 [Sphingomonas sp.]